METERFIFNCDVCNSPYQHGPGRYEGHKLELYGGIFCCDSCWRNNWDGWAHRYESTLLAHLNGKGHPIPSRNANGLLPRD